MLIIDACHSQINRMARRRDQTPLIDDQDRSSSREQGEGPVELQFLTCTHVNQVAARDTKSRVRSHAMSTVQQRLRNEREKRKGDLKVDSSSLSKLSSTGSSIEIEALAGQPHPDTLGTKHLDDSPQFAIEPNTRTRQLYEYLHGKMCAMMRTLESIGFLRIVVSDDAALHQLLYTVSSQRAALHHQISESEATALSDEALQSVNQRLADPSHNLSDGVIIAVITFAFHSIIANDSQGVATHSHGLEELVQRRGGLKSVTSDAVLGSVICWIDINAAYLLDISPRFPMLDGMLPVITLEPPFSVSNNPLLGACTTDEMVSAMRELLALVQYIKHGFATNDPKLDDIFAGLHIVPFLRRFLHSHHEMIESSSLHAKEESLRVAALLYLGGICQNFGINLKTDVFIPKLKNVITSQINPLHEEIMPWLLWVLMIGGVQSLDHEDHSFFVSTLATLMMRQGYKSWRELMDTIYQAAWIEGILDVQCNQFHLELASEIWNLYGYFIS
ncbi:hypothetical protein F5884DRAFT_804202 [Xylogone sp. PMI_703]|nr:hypothetical protein F5884DRAFT_804202 [Xylogone sp. PMI_703]